MKKMKKTKLLASLLVVMMLVMSLSTMVSAEEDTTGTLVLQNTKATTGLTLKESTCYLYEIFNYNIDTSSQTLNYDVQSEFEEFFLEKVNAELGDENKFTNEDYNTNAFNDAAMAYVSSFYVTDDEGAVVSDDMQNLVEELITYIKEGTRVIDYTVTSDSITSGNGHQNMSTDGYSLNSGVETIKVYGIESGYYLILDAATIDGAEGAPIVPAGALATLPTVSFDEESGALAKQDVTITVKGSLPTINKEVWHNDISNTNDDVSKVYDTGSWDIISDYEVGDIVEYRVTATMPSSFIGYDTYTYIISDSLPDGITYNDDYVIYTDADLSTPAKGLDYVGEGSTTNGFVLDIDMINFKAANSAYTTIYIYYTGTVTEEVEVYDSAETNTVYLEYSNDPYEDTTNTTQDSVDTYTFELEVTKTKGDGSTALAGAVFKLSYTNGADIYLAAGDAVDGVPTYYILDDEYIDTTNKLGVIETSESSDGKFIIYGLDDQVSYTLTEIAAPEGYNAASPIDFVITADYEADKVVTVSNDAISSDGYSLALTVVNTTSQLLPETGGMGTTILMASGGTMMLLAAVLLITKRRRER